MNNKPKSKINFFLGVLVGVLIYKLVSEVLWPMFFE